MGKNELAEKINQLKILVEKILEERKFDYETRDFELDFKDFMNNIKFFYKSSLENILTKRVTKQTVDDLSNAIDNLNSMKNIAQKYNDNNLANYIQSIINELEGMKNRLKPLAK